MKQEFLSLNICSSVAETKVTTFLKNYTAPDSFSFMLLDLKQKQMETIWGSLPEIDTKIVTELSLVAK